MVLGIDGGGSKTTAVLAQESGKVIACAVGGSINFYSNPLSDTRRNLSDLLQKLHVQPDAPLRSVFIGMSALNDRADDAQVHAFLDGIVAADYAAMDSDLYIALESMLHTGACAVAVCGTGSMVAGRTADGTVIHRGGYGHLLGDEGSGYAIALDAVRASLRAADHAAPPTALEPAVYAFFRAPDTDALIDRFYDPPIRRQDVAAFFPQVLLCAEQGDETARSILLHHADAFAATTLALLRELPPDAPLGLWGGVFCHAPLFRTRFCERIAPHRADILEFPPYLGAVFAAWKLCGITPTAARIDRVKQTCQNLEVE